jgi:hypothetical protein
VWSFDAGDRTPLARSIQITVQPFIYSSELTVLTMSVTTVAEAQRAGVVLGLPDVDGKPVPRRDVDDLLLNEPDTFNLFLLA